MVTVCVVFLLMSLSYFNACCNVPNFLKYTRKSIYVSICRYPMLNEMHSQEIKYLLYLVIHTRIIPTVVTPQKLCRKNFISKYCQLSSNTAHNVAVRSSQHMLYYLSHCVQHHPSAVNKKRLLLNVMLRRRRCPPLSYLLPTQRSAGNPPHTAVVN